MFWNSPKLIQNQAIAEPLALKQDFPAKRQQDLLSKREFLVHRSYWKLSRQRQEKHNKEIKVPIYISIFLVISYFLTNILFLFFQDIGFLFLRWQNKILTENILELSFIILLGALYSSIKKDKIKKILSIFTLYLGIQFKAQFEEIQKSQLKIKKVLYGYLKRNVIFNTLGETAYIPREYIFMDKNSNSEDLIFQINYLKEDEQLINLINNNNIIDNYLFVTRDFYEKQYNRIIGDYVYIVSEEQANKELEKRIILWDKKNEDDITNFKGLNKYLTFPNISKEIESPLADKITAYKMYKETNYNLAKELYKKSLIQNDSDIDILYFLYKLPNTTDKEKIKLIEKIDNLDDSSMYLKELLLEYYIEEKNYQKAINKINEIENITNITYKIGLNFKHEKIRNKILNNIKNK